MNETLRRPVATPAIQASSTHELVLQLAISSVQDEVSNVVSMISNWLGLHKVNPETVGELELVMAEALNNVVEHAYLYKDDGKIDICILLTPAKLTARIVDSGCAFDGPPPLNEVDLENCSFEDLPEGGFGWNLIRTLTDDVSFEHVGKENRLTLTRNLMVEQGKSALDLLE